MMTATAHDRHTDLSNGGRLVAVGGRELPLVGSALRVEARGGIARVVLAQTFRNPYAEPLAVTYSVPLPADGAVSGFAFRVGDKRVVGEVDRRSAARERYEHALIEGRSAALLEQERSSLFTQVVGNIPPGAEVVAEVRVDQRLRWLDEGAWEWRFPTVVAPRYLGAAGRVADADVVAQDVAHGAIAARVTLECAIGDGLADGAVPESPSHALAVTAAPGATHVALAADAGARLDRDVVVRWRVAQPRVGLALDVGRGALGRAHGDVAFGLLTIVPPRVEARGPSVPRDLVVLLDTSGSMMGEPLEQARRIVSAVIATLREHDRVELIEFSDRPRRWKHEPVAATEAARSEALKWLAALRASGGTEMRSGILEALASLRPDAQRQVVLVTDGMIGFESEVVAAICERLPASSRVHTVGVGSAVNRSLTGPAARAGRGVEVVVGPREDPERAARRLLARTDAPLVVELSLAGDALVEHAPQRMPDLFAGAPVLVAVKLDPAGGELRVHGRTAQGAWEERIVVPARAPGEGSPCPAALFAREAVEDLELVLASGGAARAIDAEIEQLGVDFQISTRLTSWVAVSEDVTVDPQSPLRRERMPHELPDGVSPEGLGLRAPVAAVSKGAFVGTALPLVDSMEDDLDFGEGASEPMARMSDVSPADAPAGVFKRMREESAPRAAPKPTVHSAPRRMAKARDVERVPAEKAAAAGERRLRARIVLHKERDVVVEASVDDAALAWSPGESVTVTFADGTKHTARVDLARTTRAGTIAAGQTLRLALQLPLGVGGTVWQIELRHGAARVILEA